LRGRSAWGVSGRSTAVNDEREQIREVLASAGVDDTRPTIDGKTELEWMTESCPSLRHAVEEAARRKARVS
jgi:hypothetical protein